MGFLTFLTGKSPEEIAAKGDEFFDAGEYGAAKMEYERALDKLEKKSEGEPDRVGPIRERLIRSREALARSHRETALNLIETGYRDEAEERLLLALDLTEDEGLGREIERIREEIRRQHSEAVREEFSDVYLEEDESPFGEIDPGGEEYFAALLSTLPDEERAVYSRYGEAFRRGFVALNQGDFEGAVRELSRALEENPEEGGFIPLELATAHLNLGHQDEAYDLLAGFLRQHPGSLKAYSILCEILWERKEYDRALERLNSCPQEGVDPVGHLLLWGETLIQAGRYGEAEALFLGFMGSRGWDENAARSLARVFEAEGSMEKARNQYLEIVKGCRSCMRAVDPFVKRRYADIGFESGEHTAEILEIYLSLAQEDPDNRGDYYRRISRIYASMGNEREAGRFRAFARELED